MNKFGHDVFQMNWSEKNTFSYTIIDTLASE